MVLHQTILKECSVVSRGTLVRVLSCLFIITIAGMSDSRAQSLSVDTIAQNGSNIQKSGDLVFAWNAAGDAEQTVNGIPFEVQTPVKGINPLEGTLTFGPVKLECLSYGVEPWFDSHDSENVATEYSDPGLGQLMKTYYLGGWQNDNISLQFKVSGLEIGQKYRIQFLSDSDSQSFDEPTNEQNVNFTFGSFSTGPGTSRQQLYTAEWTAEDKTMVFYMRASRSRASINGIALHAIQ